MSRLCPKCGASVRESNRLVCDGCRLELRAELQIPLGPREVASPDAEAERIGAKAADASALDLLEQELARHTTGWTRQSTIRQFVDTGGGHDRLALTAQVMQAHGYKVGEPTRAAPGLIDVKFIKAALEPKWRVSPRVVGNAMGGLTVVGLVAAISLFLVGPFLHAVQDPRPATGQSVSVEKPSASASAVSLPTARPSSSDAFGEVSPTVTVEPEPEPEPDPEPVDATIGVSTFALWDLAMSHGLECDPPELGLECSSSTMALSVYESDEGVTDVFAGGVGRASSIRAYYLDLLRLFGRDGRKAAAWLDGVLDRKIAERNFGTRHFVYRGPLETSDLSVYAKE